MKTSRSFRPSARQLVAIVAAVLLPTSAALSVSDSSASREAIYPGRVWLDTDGEPIHAHAAGMLKVGEVYYLYGQDQRLGHHNKTGVCCYSSTDLYNWEYQGTVLPTDETPEIYQNTGVLERPKVIYNASTGKYVMWMHLDANGYTMAEAGVAVADAPTGPFRFVKAFRPLAYDYGYGHAPDLPQDRVELIERLDEAGKGNAYRDMNLFVDDDGTGYVIYSSEDNRTLYVSKLSDDYLDIARPAVEGKTWTRAIVAQSREAPAPFKYQDKYYIISSGLTGWAPNAAQVHIADHMFGPWTSLGNPCVGPDAEYTFGAQSTNVFAAPGQPEGCFIFMADIWDSNELEKSTLFWQPFVIQPDLTFDIYNLDRWTLDVFNQRQGELAAPTLKLKQTRDGKTLTWSPVEGSDGYSIFKGDQEIGVTSGGSYTLPRSLAGAEYQCAVQAFTIHDKKSKPSKPAVVRWREASDAFLSEFEPVSWSQGYGTLQIDQALEGGPLKVVDQVFERGFGVHAPSSIVFHPNGRYSRFTAWVGADAYTSFNNFASVVFIVKGDGKELFNSGLMTATDPAQRVDVSLEGVEALKLIVTDGDVHGQRWDHANWGDPQIHR